MSHRSGWYDITNLLKWMPELKRVHFGPKCVGRSIPHSEYMRRLSAHTHMCSKDHYHKVICVWHEEMILNADGTPSELMWHEYAHLMDIPNWNNGPEGRMECNPKDRYHTIYFNHKKDKSDDFSHGRTFQKILKGFGYEPGLTVGPPKGKDVWKIAGESEIYWNKVPFVYS